MIKLVALDLDGTVLTDDKKVSTNTLKTIERCRKKGIQFAICTGRNLSEIHYISQIENLFEHIDYTISSNGAICTNMSTSTLVFEHLIKKEKVYQLMQELESINTMFTIYMDGKVYSDFHTLEKYENFITPDFFDMVNSTRIGVDNLYEFIQNSHKEVEMILVSFSDNQTRNNTYEKIKNFPLEMSLAGSKAIEFNAFQINKGSALTKLAHTLHLDKEHVLAMGDSYNDLSMRQGAKILIAMENGIDALKDSADFISKTNEADGVAYALDTFLS